MTTRKSTDGNTLVRVNRYGGFHAPAMARTAEVTEKDLSDTETAELHAMLESLDPVPASGSKRIPDAFVYEIEIERDGKRQTLEVGETSMTEAQRALVRWMEAKDKPK